MACLQFQCLPVLATDVNISRLQMLNNISVKQAGFCKDKYIWCLLLFEEISGYNC